MASKPSERTHRHRPDDSLTLTPLMDIITNLMFFLLIFANAIPVVTIDAPLPKVANTAEEVRAAKDASNKLEVQVAISNAGFVVRSDFAPGVTINKEGADFDYKALHKALAQVHFQKPEVNEITVIPEDEVDYQVIILVMDAARLYEEGDEGFKELPPEIRNSTEKFHFNQMFPNVNIGGV